MGKASKKSRRVATKSAIDGVKTRGNRFKRRNRKGERFLRNYVHEQAKRGRLMKPGMPKKVGRNET